MLSVGVAIQVSCNCLIDRLRSPLICPRFQERIQETLAALLCLILEQLGRLNAKVVVLLGASVAPLPVSAAINFADRARQDRMPQLVLIAVGAYTNQQMTKRCRFAQVLSRERKLSGIENIKGLISVGPHDNGSARWIQLLARRHPAHPIINYDDETELRRSLQC